MHQEALLLTVQFVVELIWTVFTSDVAEKSNKVVATYNIDEYPACFTGIVLVMPPPLMVMVAFRSVVDLFSVACRVIS